MRIVNPALVGGLVAVLLFLGTLALLEVGRQIGLRRLAREGEAAEKGFGALESAVFALLGLLIAFTFAGAVSRFDVRRQQVVDEANAVGTAYLRIDLLPAAAQPALRETFRRYLDSRLATYSKVSHLEAAQAELRASVLLQGEIWAQAVAGCRMPESPPPACMLLLPALNQMIDITTTRTMATYIHPPLIVFVMLVALVLATALLAGYDLALGRSRNWLHMLGFAAILASTVYVILDIEYPRRGLIRLDAIDRVLVDLRASMK